jgi:hypothetical protein
MSGHAYLPSGTVHQAQVGDPGAALQAGDGCGRAADPVGEHGQRPAVVLASEPDERAGAPLRG